MLNIFIGDQVHFYGIQEDRGDRSDAGSWRNSVHIRDDSQTLGSPHRNGRYEKD